MSDIKVQWFNGTISGTGHTTTVSVDTVGGWNSGATQPYSSNAFVILTGWNYTSGWRGAGTGWRDANNAFATARLTAADTVTVRRSLGVAPTLDDDLNFAGAVVEYIGPSGGANEFIVRDCALQAAWATAQLDVNPDTNGAAISDLTDVSAICCAELDNVEPLGDLVAIYPVRFNDGGTLKVSFKRTGTTAVDVLYHIIEWTGSNWTITEEIGATSATGVSGVTESYTITSVTDITKTFFFFQFESHTAATGPDDYPMGWLSAATTFKTRYDSTAARVVDWSAFFHYNPELVVEHADTVDGALGALSTTVDEEDWTVNDTPQALALCSMASASTGGARLFVEPSVRMKADGVTLHTERDTDGNATQWQYQVASFAAMGRDAAIRNYFDSMNRRNS